MKNIFLRAFDHRQFLSNLNEDEPFRFELLEFKLLEFRKHDRPGRSSKREHAHVET